MDSAKGHGESTWWNEVARRVSGRMLMSRVGDEWTVPMSRAGSDGPPPGWARMAPATGIPGNVPDWWCRGGNPYSTPTLVLRTELALAG
ncbi:MAG: hypothetical protein ACP5PM_10445 [Acidimicrobiales bacterium]